jgi:hypothetical protein
MEREPQHEIISSVINELPSLFSLANMNATSVFNQELAWSFSFRG